MFLTVEHLGLYLHLARAAELRRQPLVRDRLLVLAGVLAVRLDLLPIAECCRARILLHNRRHLLRRWPTLAESADEPDVQCLVVQLLRRYSPEQAEQLLAQLEIERGAERAVYESDGEYAAALLGERWTELERRFSDPST
jgi:hypothetical protein